VKDSLGHTRFVPLYKVQMDSSMSTRSPKVYPNAGPLEMADATADLRKSMASVTEERLHVHDAEDVVADYSQARWRLPPCGHALRFLFRATRGKLQAPQPITRTRATIASSFHHRRRRRIITASACWSAASTRHAFARCAFSAEPCCATLPDDSSCTTLC
jgi:hypothetical protein